MNKTFAALRQYWIRLSTREQMIAAVCLSVLGLFLFVQGVVTPYFSYLGDLQAQIEARQMKAVKYQRWLKAGAGKAQPDDASRESAGDESEDMARFLKMIEQLSRDCGARIVDLKPIKADVQDIRQKVGLDLQLNASLPALMSFLHQLRASPRLLEVHRFQLISGDGPALRASLLITETFFLREPVRSPVRRRADNFSAMR